MAPLSGSPEGVFVGNVDLVVIVRAGLAGDTRKASQPSLRRANDPYRRAALTAGASTVGLDCGFQLPLYLGAIGIGIGVKVQLNIYLQLDRRETGILHQRLQVCGAHVLTSDLAVAREPTVA
jgi:hypothetical protein